MAITEDIKKLGFGMMRLPKLPDGKIDVEQTKTMVDLFLDAGFNYFDTAWAYGGSEEAVKEALVDRYPREKFYLATKCAAWIKCNSREDAISQFDVSLKKTGAGYFDFYLLHNLGEGRTKFFDQWNLWDWALELKEKGLVRHVGFSFHSTADELDELLTKHPQMEFVQLQINYADWETNSIQSKKCLEVAKKHGKPVIVMEPVKGGMLATPPENVVKALQETEKDSSPSSWAVRFAADLDGIMVVLSGMSDIAQMKDNLSHMKGFSHFTDEQRKAIEKAREELKKVPIVHCTTCNYCAKVCPKNVGISGSFEALNYLILFNNKEKAKGKENWFVTVHGFNHATDCVKCGKCETVCPQHIKIRDNLQRVCDELLS